MPRDTQFLPHPSHGGSRGYDTPFREMILENYHARHPVRDCLMRSVRRWLKGRIPCRMTGNKSRSESSGHYLFLLVLFTMILPHLSYDECIAFIANKMDNAKIFNEIAVNRALRKLGYTTKINSMVTCQAFTTRNLICCQQFWNEPWPVGVYETLRQRIIDADDFRLHLNAANKNIDQHHGG